MNKNSYNQRLKEIRQKYGSSVKDTTSCLRTDDRIYSKIDSKYDDKYSDKYSISKKVLENSSDRKAVQNSDPLLRNYTGKYTSSFSKENQPIKTQDSFLYTKSKEERLKQIEKIRSTLAQSRNQALDDFNRQIRRSKSKYVEQEKYGGLRQRVNTNLASNPEDLKLLSNQSSSRQGLRNRIQSYTSTRIDSQLNSRRQIMKNYGYNYNLDKDISSTKQIRTVDSKQQDQKAVNTIRNYSVSRFDRQTSFTPAKKDLSYAQELRYVKQIDSQTTSPIRGLMKLDSLEKPRKTQTIEHQFSAAKLAPPSYDLTNIDKIQDRIQKILAKK